MIEKSIIGCVLLGNGKQLPDLCVEDFHDPKNKQVWESFEKMKQEGITIDLVTASERNIGVYGPEAFAEMQNLVPTPTHLKYYVEKLKDRNGLENLQKIGRQLQAINPSTDSLDEIVSKTLVDLRKSVKNEVKTKNMTELYEEYCERMSAVGIKTGNKMIDNKTKGVQAGSFWIVNAYSGSGKTTMAMQMARQFLIQKKKVVFYSLEMDAWRVYEMFERIMKSKKESIDRLHYEWNNQLKIVNGIRSWGAIEFDAMQREPDVIIVDFAQIVHTEGRNEYERMQRLAQNIQQFCRESQIPVLLLSQVSVASENSDTTVVNAKGGGDLFAMSDVFLYIRRDHKLEQDQKRIFYSKQPGFESNGLFERNLVILKNRFGSEAGCCITYNFRDGAGVYMDF